MSGDASQANVRVVVRVRPENELERQIDSLHGPAIRVLDDNCLIFDPIDEEDSFIRDNHQPIKSRKASKKRQRDVRFAFDRVFEGNSTQEEVYLDTTGGVVCRVMSGVNCCVFAYGATGAGKTYTMLGSSEEPGVTFRTVQELFDLIGSKQEEISCDVKVSYLEVYNETIHDLLKPSGALAVREDPVKGVCIRGLSFYKPQSAAELLEMLRRGNENRTQHPTDANAQSSRSHAMFQVIVRQKPCTSGLSMQFKVAKLSLIDLAGSERATMTTNRGMRLREGANINRSLLALGNCINALVEQKTGSRKAIHVPYRDSKLTRLLKDSLGGNCCTVMVANVSPSRMCYEDTYNTLKYAERAKSIKSKLFANTVNVDLHVSKYRSIIEGLQAENKELRIKLQQQLQTVPAGVPCVADINENSAIDKSCLQRIETELCPLKSVTSVCLDLTDIEAAQRDVIAKGQRKERNIQRMKAIGKENAQCINKWTAALSAVSVCQSDLSNRQKKLLSDKKQSEQQLKQAVISLGLGPLSWNSSKFGDCDTVGKLMVRNHQLEMEKEILSRQVKHFRQFCKVQNKSSQNAEKLIHHLCKYIAHVTDHFMSVIGTIPKHLNTEFESLLHFIEVSGKELAWADESNISSLVSDQPATVLQANNSFSRFNTKMPAIATTSGILTPSVRKTTEEPSSQLYDRFQTNDFQSSTMVYPTQGTVPPSDISKEPEKVEPGLENNKVGPDGSTTSSKSSVSRDDECAVMDTHSKKIPEEKSGGEEAKLTDQFQPNQLQPKFPSSSSKSLVLLPPPPRHRTPRRSRRRVTFTVDNPINIAAMSQQNASNQEGTNANAWATSTDPAALESLFKPLVCPPTPKTYSNRSNVSSATPSRIPSRVTRSTTPARTPSRVTSSTTPSCFDVLRSCGTPKAGPVESKSPFSIQQPDSLRLPQRRVVKKKAQDTENVPTNSRGRHIVNSRSRLVGGMKRPNDGAVHNPSKRANIAASNLARRGLQPQWHVWN